MVVNVILCLSTSKFFIHIMLVMHWCFFRAWVWRYFSLKLRESYGYISWFSYCFLNCWMRYYIIIILRVFIVWTKSYNRCHYGYRYVSLYNLSIFKQRRSLCIGVKLKQNLIYSDKMSTLTSGVHNKSLYRIIIFFTNWTYIINYIKIHHYLFIFCLSVLESIGVNNFCRAACIIIRKFNVKFISKKTWISSKSVNYHKKET